MKRGVASSRRRSRLPWLLPRRLQASGPSLSQLSRLLALGQQLAGRRGSLQASLSPSRPAGPVWAAQTLCTSPPPSRICGFGLGA